MKMSQFVGKQIKETPKEAQTMSHIFLIRGGYVRPVSTGIFSLLPLGRRITQKIEAIIREEMNREDGDGSGSNDDHNGINGQEVLMPVVLPRDLWEESGRYQSVGPELLRFKDRNQKDMLLGMTHEEAVVHLARSEVNSYKQLPMMLYQIQTKYRDEARPRAGLIRVREFTMKDAYSFHATQECLESYYPKIHEAYVKIFNRLGMKSVVSIESDTGMMGGKVSHEFMAVAECGEDTIFICSHCQYRANREVAITHYAEQSPSVETLKKVHTPGKTSIEEVSQFLNQSSQKTGKAVFYTGSPLQQPDKTQLVFVVIRGDLEVNETKLRNQLQLNDLKFATDEQIRSIGSVPGYASPIGIDFSKVKVVFDTSLKNQHDLIVGANEVDQHYINFSHSRDLDPALQQKIQWIDIANVKNHDPCPLCQHPLQEKRGIEVGNIFQLGTKYSESMKCNFLDQQGKSRPMIMGCYGIGVGRSMASVIEQSHDTYGPIWPYSIAPFHVHLIALNYNDETIRTKANALYQQLKKANIEVLFDDRNEKAGSAFSSADLIGAPLRVILSPKNLEQGVIELKLRNPDHSALVAEVCPDLKVTEQDVFSTIQKVLAVLQKT